MKTTGQYRSAIDWAHSIRTGELSSVEVTRIHLERINQVNPTLNAVVQLAPERAIYEAQAADEAIASGLEIGPLHGVPITLKDSIDTAGIVTTWGTTGRRNTVPAQDATIVTRLRSAGAIVIGKTNTPEFTLGGAMDNDVYGPTRHPWDQHLCPGFSSGGSAAIIAAGGSPLDFGTDTGGSIREPAHFCGIAGIKPTAGRVPRTGHAVPFGLGPLDVLTQIGPMARTVSDLKIALKVIEGPDWRDPAVVHAPTGDMSVIPIKGLRIAWYTDGGLAKPIQAIATAIESAASKLAQSGARTTLAAPQVLPRSADLYPALCYADGGAWLERLLERAGTPGGGHHMQRVLENARRRVSTEPMQIYQAVDNFRSDMMAFMHDFDAIICPIEAGLARPPTPPRGDATPGDWVNLANNWAHMAAYNLTGWPAVAVPAGISDGLPFGLQVVAQPWRDDVALAIAAFIERHLGGFVPPPDLPG